MSAADPGRARLGTLLRRHRIAAGLTQEELGEGSGLSVRAISNIERGTTARPYGRSIRLLADALALPDQALEELAGIIWQAEGRDLPRATGSLTGPAGPVAQPWIVPRQLPPAVSHFTG